MPSSLGLYIGNHIIKYAKVTKDANSVKVDSFGIKFYENLTDTIHQVINETYSYKIPISVNLYSEKYNYFYLFSMLNQKDIKGIINTEFESVCYDQGINKDAYETRYMLVNEIGDKEKIRAIHISADKTEINKKLQQLEGNKVGSITPLAVSITNLLEFKQNENVAIVNIEDYTTVTTVLDGKIYDIHTMEDGMDEILRKINAKENSYSKAYDKCRNSTIYTSDAKDLQLEENLYLEDIMPTLYNIVGNVRKIVNESLNKIDKIYITGTACVINNIDIYFQEYLQDVKCEILRPYFIQNVSTKINIKDYIEINSAIALALQGVNEGIKNVNFKKTSFSDKMSELTKSEKSPNSSNPNPIGAFFSKLNMNFDFSLRGEFSRFERTLLRMTSAILSALILYIVFSTFLLGQIDDQKKEVNLRTQQTAQQIDKIKEDTATIESITKDYQTVIQQIKEINEGTANSKQVVISTLLNQIMFAIPKEVQITSIQNSAENKVTIQAQSESLDALGYFKSAIINTGILYQVESSQAIKQDNIFLVTIEGDLL